MQDNQQPLMPKDNEKRMAPYLRYPLVIFGIAFMAAPFFVISITLFPSDSYQTFIKPLTLGLTILLTLVGWYLLFIKQPKINNSGIRKTAFNKWILKPALAFFLPIMSLFWVYAFVSLEIGLALHYIDGPTERIYDWTVEKKSYAKRCKYGIKLKDGNGFNTSRLCDINEELFQQLKPGSQIMIKGMESRFGFKPEAIMAVRVK